MPTQPRSRTNDTGQLRQPRLADMVADQLRDRILSGELPDGAMLPKQGELLAEFRVSSPSVREALRILETEGLITVLRGNVGGAVVHEPRAERAAYMLAMVLERRQVALDDVVGGIAILEPSCAGACAGRKDRRKAVLPGLTASIKAAEAHIDDPELFAHEARTFHEHLVATCGNETLTVVVGAVEAIWSAQVREARGSGRSTAVIQEQALRERALSEHRAIRDAIRDGDVELAERLSREHLSGRYEHPMLGQGGVVRATKVS